jgi:dihydropteroate synthase
MFTLNCKGRLLVVDKPLLMGIMNITPDSFYTGSRFENTDSILKKAEQMLKEGADILDIGGQSTRPRSVPITADEELQRVLGTVESISKNFPGAFVSVDTYYSKVAAETVAAGACMINDVSGGSMDKDLLSTVASLQVPYVLMHMQGNPKSMQQNPQYENLVKEVLDFFIAKLEDLRQAGIHDVIVDPGFGFGKTIAHNFQLLRHLSVFKILNRPILLGLSRKSTIYKTLGIEADEALNGTTVLNTIGLMNGAGILRVHDIKEAKEAIKLVEACYHT